MVTGKKWLPFFGPKFWFLAQKSDFCHTTPILIDDPFLALGMTVNFPPWKPFFDFPFRSYSCFRKKILRAGLITRNLYINYQQNVAFPSLLTLLHSQISSIILLLSLVSLYIHRKDVLQKFKRSEHFNIKQPFQPSDFSRVPSTPPIPSPLWLGARPHCLANWSPFHFTSLGTPRPSL